MPHEINSVIVPIDADTSKIDSKLDASEQRIKDTSIEIQSYFKQIAESIGDDLGDSLYDAQFELKQIMDDLADLDISDPLEEWDDIAEVTEDFSELYDVVVANFKGYKDLKDSLSEFIAIVKASDVKVVDDSVLADLEKFRDTINKSLDEVVKFSNELRTSTSDLDFAEELHNDFERIENDAKSVFPTIVDEAQKMNVAGDIILNALRDANVEFKSILKPVQEFDNSIKGVGIKSKEFITLKESVKELSKEFKAFTNSAKRSVQDIAGLEPTFQATDKAIEALRDTIYDLEKRYDSAVNTISKLAKDVATSDVEIQRLTKSLNKTEANLAKTTLGLVDLKNIVKTLSSDLSSATSSIGRLERENARLLAKFEQLESKVSGYKAELDGCKESIKGYQKEITGLNREIESNIGAFIKVDDALLEQQNKTRKAEEALKSYKAEVGKNNQALRGFADDVKTISLYVSDLDGTIKGSQSELTKMSNDVDKSSKVLQSYGNSIDNVMQSLAGLGDDQDGALDFFSRQGVDIQQLIANYNELRLAHTTLSTSFTELGTKLSKEENELKGLRTELSVAENNLKTLSKSQNTSNKEVDDARKKVETLTKAYKDKEKTVQSLKGDLNDLANTQSKLQHSMSTMATDVRNADESMDAYSTALAKSKAELKQLEGVLLAHSKGVKNATVSINGLKGAMGSLLAMMGGRELYTWLIGNEAEYVRAEKQLGLLIDDTQKATVVMQELRDLAITSPYTLPDLQLMTKQLAGTALQIEQIQDLIPRIANLGQGDADKMTQINKVIQDVVTAGKLQGEELRQLKNTGIDATTEIARIMGVTTSELKKLQKEGEVTSDIFLEAIRNITDEGGKYFGLMDAMAEDYLGQIAQLKGHIIEIGKSLGRELGGELQGTIENINSKLREMQNSGELDEHIKDLATDLKEIFLILKDFGGMLLSFGSFLIENKELVYTLAKGFLAWKISTSFISGILSINTKLKETVTFAKAFNSYLTKKNMIDIDFTSVRGLKDAISSVVTVTHTADGAMAGLSLTTKGVALSTKLLTGGLWGIAIALSGLIGYNIGQILGKDLAEANKAIVETKNLIAQTEGTLVNLFTTYGELKAQNQDAILEIAVGLEDGTLEDTKSELSNYIAEIYDIQENHVGELTDYQKETVSSYAKTLEEQFGITGLVIDEATGRVTNLYDMMNSTNIDLAILNQFESKLEDVSNSTLKQVKQWNDLKCVLESYGGGVNLAGNNLDALLRQSGMFLEQDISYLREMVVETEGLEWTYDSLLQIATKNAEFTKGQSDAVNDLSNKYNDLKSAGVNAGQSIADVMSNLGAKTEDAIYYVEQLTAKLDNLDGRKISIDSEVSVDDLALDDLETFLSKDITIPDEFFDSVNSAVEGLSKVSGSAQEVVDSDLADFYDLITFKQMELDTMLSSGAISFADYEYGYSTLLGYMTDGTRTISELAPTMSQRIFEMLSANETNMQSSFSDNVAQWSALLQDFAYYAIDVGLITESEAHSIINNIKTATGELQKELEQKSVDSGKEKYNKVYNPPKKRESKPKEKTPEQKANEELQLLKRKLDAEMITIEEYERKGLSIRNKYFKKGQLEYIENTKKIQEIVKKHNDELLKLEKESLDDRLELTEKYLAEQQFKGYVNDNFISAFKRVQSRYKDALNRGILDQKEYNSIMDKLGDEAYASRLAQSERWIDVQLRQNNLSYNAEVEAWGRIARYTKDAYKEGLISYTEYKEKMQDINDTYFDISYKYLEKQLDKLMTAERKSYDKRKQEINDYYDAIDKAETKEEREKELDELLALEEKFSHATTAQGKKRLEDIQKQIQEIKKAEEKEKRDEERQKELDALDDEFNAFEESMTLLQDNLGKFAEQLTKEFEKTGTSLDTTFSRMIDNMVLGFGDISSSITPIGQQLSQLVADLNTFNNGFKNSALSGMGGITNQTVQVVNNNNVTVKSNTDARAFGSSIDAKLGMQIASKGGF